MSVITENLATVKKHIEELSIKAGRSADAVKLIAVSKTRTLAEVQQAIAAGQSDFGENTVKDALTKIPELTTRNINWHFIGHLQSKQAKHIPGNFDWIHSVDSIKLANKLSTAVVQQQAKNLECLIQVNVSGEASKSGIKVTEAEPFINELLLLNLPGLNWRGLMTIGVQGDDKQTGNAFATLRNLLVDCQHASGLKDFDQLSMGMSNDYSIAIQEGSTLVRVGTAIFGERNYNQK